ncbi:hypothetical protein [Clostridium intestinale]|uniref:hypothetical protein n=1 Tax=Clostridium intestinale TaxID=36845 RepID=UPI002DD654E7|nr:hypothetical protein [Clostridium intestinale]WRY52608.1 hypothetical protein P8F83_05275 [Clostridium intestinale]
MKREYVLVDSNKLNLPNWKKWLMLIGGSFIALLLISVLENLLSNAMEIQIEKIAVVTFYIRAFIVLALIHDLAPKLKKLILILWSMVVYVVYVGIDYTSGDKLFLGSLVFFIFLVGYNIFLFRKKKNHMTNI